MSPLSQHLKVKVECSSFDSSQSSRIVSTENSISKLDGNEGFVRTDVYNLYSNDTLRIPSIDGTEYVLIFSNAPFNVYMHLSSTSGEIDFGLQTVFSMSTTYSSPIRIENTTSDNYIPVTIVRLTNVGNNPVSSYKQQYTIGRLERIFSLGFSVTSIEQLYVTDVTLEPWENSQITPPSTLAGNKYRVCDSDGTPNEYGSYIMLLNDIVTQQNLCGNLKINVSYLQ